MTFTPRFLCWPLQWNSLKRSFPETELRLKDVIQEVRRGTTMAENSTNAMKEAANKKFDALMDKIAEIFAKQIKGHF